MTTHHPQHPELNGMTRESLPAIGQSISVWNGDLTRHVAVGEVVAIDDDAITVVVRHDRTKLTRIPYQS